MSVTIPCPPVFHDWRYPDRRVSTCLAATGVSAECLCPELSEKMGIGVWHSVELTETDAALYAAALLERAGYKKLSKRVLKKLTEEVGP